MHACSPPSRSEGCGGRHDSGVRAFLAILAVVRSRRTRGEHGGLPCGARVGCGRIGCPLPGSARASSRPAEWSPRGRSADDRRIRAPRAAAQPGCGARSAGRGRGRRSAAAVARPQTDDSESRREGAPAEGEATAHRHQAAASTAYRLRRGPENPRRGDRSPLTEPRRRGQPGVIPVTPVARSRCRVRVAARDVDPGLHRCRVQAA